MSALPVPHMSDPASRRPRPLPLEMGARMTRAEFERRFDATPNLKKAELLEGTVYTSPPVSYTYHGYPHTTLNGLLFVYAAATQGVSSGTDSSLRLDLDNMPQPDVFLMIRPEHGGQAKIDEEGYVQGAPELIAEVAASSSSYDLHIKMNVYRRSGVKEYIVWRTYDAAIDFFTLVEGRYDPAPLEDGIFKSQVFPGLWIDASALLKGDLASALQTVQKGIASPEHADFIARLNSQRST